MARSGSSTPKLFDSETDARNDPSIILDDHANQNQFGLLSVEMIRLMSKRKMIRSSDSFDDGQFQPASLDLRLGSKAYRVRSSFLPGKERSVEQALANFKHDEIKLDGTGAVLERGCVYVIPLIESLELQQSISAVANPKSSTGRLDIFTRLITDQSEVFDHVATGYRGPLYAEVSPRSFSVRVRRGSRLNQIRFRRRNSRQLHQFVFALSDEDLRKEHESRPLVMGP